MSLGSVCASVPVRLSVPRAACGSPAASARSVVGLSIDRSIELRRSIDLRGSAGVELRKSGAAMEAEGRERSYRAGDAARTDHSVP